MRKGTVVPPNGERRVERERVPEHSSAHQRWFDRTLFVALGSAILGLLALLASGAVKASFWSALLSQLATLLLVAGIWTAVYDRWLRHDFLQTQTDALLAVFSSVQSESIPRSIGCTRIMPATEHIDYTMMVREARDLVVVMNYARSWTSVYQDDLAARLRDPGKTTQFYLVHPESALVQILAKKEGRTPEEVVGKIQETLRTLERLRGPNSKLAVWGHFFINTYVLVIGDGEAVLTPYFLSSERRGALTYVFTDVGPASYYQLLIADLRALEQDSQILLSSPTDDHLAAASGSGA